MILRYNLHIAVCIVVLSLITGTVDREELLKQSPDMWPGHLEPFGSKQNIVEVSVLYEWPNPIEFFENYVEKSVPVVFKGLAKRSPAYQLFSDDFLKTFVGADEEMVDAETRKKEDRNQQGLHMSFKEFIQRYHNESLYMVSSLPKQLRKYVLMPAPLRCEETKELLHSQVTWFSSGGTKSVIHNDDSDNINCLYRGKKQLLFVEYNKNKNFIPIDHPEGGYSSVDVDSVDYVKYPMLRFVDQYHNVTMEEGDCLFIPYHWFHQVNSVANDKGQNLAINVWFRHVFNHKPVRCDVQPNEATLDKYSFSDEDRNREGADDIENTQEEEEEQRLSITILNHVGLLKKQEAKMKTFIKLLSKILWINPTKVKLPKQISEEYRESAEKIFKLLDQDHNDILTVEDMKKVQRLNAEDLAKLDSNINPHVAILENIFEDLEEEANREMLRKKSNEQKNNDGKEEL